MKTALIVVDVQRDFLPGGVLEIPDGDAIIPEIFRLAAEVREEIGDRDPDLVFVSRDLHPPEHVSFTDEPEYRDGSWPWHCLRGTWGAGIDPRIRQLVDYRQLSRVFSKGTDPGVEQYSAFDGRDGWARDLGSVLRRLGVTDLIVTGLALDYCVKATAIDAAALGFDVRVPLAATRATSKERERRAVKELIGSGVVVESFEDVRAIASTKEDR